MVASKGSFRLCTHPTCSTLYQGSTTSSPKGTSVSNVFFNVASSHTCQHAFMANRHIKPGGYIEFQELNYTPHCDDDSMTEPYAFRKFMAGLRDGMTALGNDLNGAINLFKEVNEAGFLKVTETRLKCPVGIWPKDRTLRLAGLYWRTAIMDGLNGLANRSYGNGLQWSREAIEVFLVDVRKSLMDTSKHVYFPLHIIYGQKPAL